MTIDLNGYTQVQVEREAQRRFRNHFGYGNRKDLRYVIMMKDTQP